MPLVPAVPPASLLAVLLVLLATQVAYLTAPAGAGYLARLGVSALAVAVGELVAALGAAAQLTVGDLHPLPDLALLVAAHWSLGWWRRRARPA